MSVFSTTVHSICGRFGDFHNSTSTTLSSVDQSVIHPARFWHHSGTVQVAARTSRDPIELASVSLAYHTSANLVARLSLIRRRSGTVQVIARTLHDPIQLVSVNLAYRTLVDPSFFRFSSSLLPASFRLSLFFFSPSSALAALYLHSVCQLRLIKSALLQRRFSHFSETFAQPHSLHRRNIGHSYNFTISSSSYLLYLKNKHLKRFMIKMQLCD